MRIPLHSDPDVLEQRYARFPYLGGQPLDLRGVSADYTVIGMLQTDSAFAFVGADPMEPLPYPPDVHFSIPVSVRRWSTTDKYKFSSPSPGHSSISLRQAVKIPAS